MHMLVGSFAEEDQPGTTRRGGVVVGILAEIMRAARMTETAVHQRARAMSVSVENGSILCVSTDPGQSLRARRQLVTKVSGWVRSRSGCHFLMGDWNSITSDEVRTTSDGYEAKAPGPLSSHIEAEVAGMMELYQAPLTFRRLAAAPAELSTFVLTGYTPCRGGRGCTHCEAGRARRAHGGAGT